MSSLFKIFSPEDCDFYYDGELQGHIAGNDDRSFRFEVEKKGTYRFKFVNSKHKSELRETHTIGEDEEKILDLDFSEVNKVIIRIEAEKREAEEAERKRRIEAEKREAEEAERRHRIEVEKRKAEEEKKIRLEKERRKREAEEAERRHRIEVEKRKAKEEERYKRIASALGGASECFAFSEGMARIKKDGKYGFMDMMGNMVIPFQYDDVCKYFEYEYMHDFHEGLACIGQNEKFGFIDKGGNLVIPCVYNEATRFSDGLAKVWHKFDHDYINKDGDTVLKLRSHEVGCNFNKGLACVSHNSKWGCIDMTGKVVIPHIYDKPFGFSEGLAYVTKGGNHMFIDINQQIVIDLHKNVDWVGCYCEGLAAVQRDKKWSFIDTKGKEVIHCNCDWLRGSFCEGLAMFSRNKKCGFIDKNGNEVIPCIYDYAKDFSEGLALVQRNGGYGYINKQGLEVIPCIYQWGTSFSEGYAFVRTRDRKWALIDKFGNSIVAE